MHATDFLRTMSGLFLLVSLVSCLPAFLWSDRYGLATRVAFAGAFFGASFLFSVWWWARYFAKRLAKPLDDLPARFGLLPGEPEPYLPTRQVTGALVLFMLFMGWLGTRDGMPGGMLLAGAACGVISVSWWVAKVERERGGRLVYLLIPGPSHTGTRLWIVREPV
ncbi:hypothetical protein ACFQ2M_04370 [Kitasatospora saccharophila]|uniref:hypothetical protein n=1 Tax=Kitasatospora saccharophila TaxID=407973 RepID=UPI0031DBB294